MIPQIHRHYCTDLGRFWLIFVSVSSPFSFSPPFLFFQPLSFKLFAFPFLHFVYWFLFSCLFLSSILLILYFVFSSSHFSSCGLFSFFPSILSPGFGPTPSSLPRKLLSSVRPAFRQSSSPHLTFLFFLCAECYSEGSDQDSDNCASTSCCLEAEQETAEYESVRIKV